MGPVASVASLAPSRGAEGLPWPSEVSRTKSGGGHEPPVSSEGHMTVLWRWGRKEAKPHPGKPHTPQHGDHTPLDMDTTQPLHTDHSPLDMEATHPSIWRPQPPLCGDHNPRLRGDHTPPPQGDHISSMWRPQPPSTWRPHTLYMETTYPLHGDHTPSTWTPHSPSMWRPHTTSTWSPPRGQRPPPKDEQRGSKQGLGKPPHHPQLLMSSLHHSSRVGSKGGGSVPEEDHASFSFRSLRRELNPFMWLRYLSALPHSCYSILCFPFLLPFSIIMTFSFLLCQLLLQVETSSARYCVPSSRNLSRPSKENR